MEKKKKWIIILAVVIGLFAFGKYNEAQKAKEKALQPKEVEEVKKPKTYVELFDEKNFSEFSGYYKPVRNYLKKNLNDPSSLEIDKTWNLGMNKDSTFAIKTTFRANNEYNALILQAIYCDIDFEGNLSNIRIE